MPIVKDGLLVYYNAKQNNQPVPYLEDLSGNGYHAEIVGATVQHDTIYFDGVDDHLLLPLINEQTDYTIEAWVNYELGSRTQWLIVFNDDNNGIRLDTENSYTESNIRIIQQGQSRSGDNAGYNTSGVMRHYVVRYNANTKTVSRWIDTQRLSDLRFNADMDMASGQGVIGSRTTGSSSTRLLGFIGAFRIYDRALTDAEITQNRAVGLDIGLDDYVDVTYDYPLQQLVYKDVTSQAVSIQSIYAIRSVDAPLYNEIYKSVTADNPIATSIYRHVFDDMPITVAVYSDVLLQHAMEQRIYVLRHDPVDMLLALFRNVYDNYATVQQVYKLVIADAPILIIVAPSYTQSVYFDVSINRSMQIATSVTRVKRIEVRI